MRKKDKCPDNGEIQAFIDNELAGSSLEKVKVHLESCDDCKEHYREMVSWADKIKKAIRTGEPEDHGVPIFTGDIKDLKQARERKAAGKFLHRILPRIAALLIIGLITWLIVSDNKDGAYEPTAYDLMLWEENMAGNDANRLWHMQNQPLMIIEPDYE